MDNLKKAVELIESEGGIVMLPSEHDVQFVSDEEIQAKKQKEEDDNKSDFEQRKSDAFDDFDKMVEKPFSYNDAEEMMLSHGLEMDYLEEYINEMY